MLRKIVPAAFALISIPVAAQAPSLEVAIATGRVGERFDGFMGFAAPPSEGLRRQVIAVNIRRRSLYADLAAQRNVSAGLVGLTTACSLFQQLAAGEAYMLNDQVWRRSAPGHAAQLPEHCR